MRQRLQLVVPGAQGLQLPQLAHLLREAREPGAVQPQDLEVLQVFDTRRHEPKVIVTEVEVGELLQGEDLVRELHELVGGQRERFQVRQVLQPVRIVQFVAVQQQGFEPLNYGQE